MMLFLAFSIDLSLIYMYMYLEQARSQGGLGGSLHFSVKIAKACVGGGMPLPHPPPFAPSSGGPVK